MSTRVYFAGANKSINMSRVPSLDERVMIGEEVDKLKPGVYKVIRVTWIADFDWQDSMAKVELEWLYY